VNCLVTGGAGFIGSHLTEHLVNDEHDVIVLDDLSNGHIENLGHIQPKRNFRFVKGDVRDQPLVESLGSQVDVIYHLATRCLVQGLEDPTIMHSVNDLGTYNVCIAARKHDCKIVYIGTSEQYGNQTEFPIKETNPMKPISIYGLTKGVAEKYVQWHSKMYGVPAVCLRVFNTYGPRHREDGYAAVITTFMKQLRDNVHLTIQGDGEQTREFTYISDVIDGIIGFSKLNGRGEVINIGSGEEISILNLAKQVFLAWYKLLSADNVDAGIVFTPPRIHDIRRFYADISKARSYGYSPKVSLQEGLRMYVDWYQEKERCKQ
jgi:nucleoside-diphosphate-sugar epimerase